MELKSAEREVDDLQIVYELVRHHHNLLKETLPELRLRELHQNEPPSEPLSEPAFQETSDILKTLDSLQQRMHILRGQVDVFLKRSKSFDPVTGKPRYGEKTLTRIETLIGRFRELDDNLSSLGVTGDSTSEAVGATVLDSIRHQAALEEEAARKQLEREKEIKKQEEERRKAAEALRIEKEQLEAAEADKEAERIRMELASQAEEARLAQQRARDEARQADREWEQSIEKGAEGVKNQLSILVDSTVSDTFAQKTALTALHTLFSQIVARPEEPNFRRIRRDHAKFNSDIGRHPGGREILIAAGFVLGQVDDVPCYLSKEPNIETDMDGWGKWYDLLKTSLEAIEEQLKK